MLVAAALVGLVAAASAIFAVHARRRSVIPDELRPVIIEEALRRARSKQQAVTQDLTARHDRAS